MIINKKKYSSRVEFSSQMLDRLWKNINFFLPVHEIIIRRF